MRPRASATQAISRRLNTLLPIFPCSSQLISSGTAAELPVRPMASSADTVTIAGKTTFGLTDLFGARLGPVSEVQGDTADPVRGTFAPEWGDGEFACRWAQSLLTTDKDPAEVLATFGTHDLEGAPAATRKRFGEGKAIFVGVSRPDEATPRRRSRDGSSGPASGAPPATPPSRT